MGASPRALRVIAIGMAACCGSACSSDKLIPDCTPDPSPTLLIDTTSLPLGVVTTEGACTPVHCAAAEGSGCRLWVGDITSIRGLDHCTIVLTLPSGRRLSKSVETIGNQCGAPTVTRVTFVL